jgi:predicted TIM-barrel fold metal-dependent hydrolase
MTETFPPRGACDCHVHVFGPKARFPLAAARTYTPMDAPRAALEAMLTRQGLDRVVLVQPSTYGFDNACMMDAIDALGNRARGVAVLAPGTAGSGLDDLHRRGVRGLRVNVASSALRGIDVVRGDFEAAAALCARNGWHLQTFAATETLVALASTIETLPVPLVVDHFGLVKPGEGDGAPPQMLLRLLGRGKIWVKLSGTYRIADDPTDARIVPLARRFADANPERIVWGSDWPHTPPHTHKSIADDVEVPYQDIDTRGLLDFTRAWFDDATALQRLLVDNPAKLYDFGSRSS